jgi:putative transposase
LADRRSDLLVREVAALRASVSRTRALYPFSIDAWVVLPEHLHAVWTLPEGDADFPTRWTLIKRGFSARIEKGESRSASRIAKGERGIWQRRFWEHTVRNEADFARHVDYVHFNPVKHGLVSSACDWPFSSFRRAVAVGYYPTDWGGRRYLESSAKGRRDETASKGWGAEEHPTLRLLPVALVSTTSAHTDHRMLRQSR